MIRITFFTGAGISEASGIPTFRSAGGLWNNFDPAEVCSVRGYTRNRKKVLDFHNEIRRFIDTAEPNGAHLAIAALEKIAKVVVVTQNIDDLHERAGSTDVIKIHGDIHTAKLKRYKEPVIPWRTDILPDSYPPGHEGCRGTMRHDVVFFGEQIKRSKAAQNAINASDYLVVCGTSLAVYPAAGFVLDARGPVKIYVDQTPSPENSAAFAKIIAREAVLGIPEAIEFICGEEKI